MTSLIGLTEELDFNIWFTRFIFTILSFPLFVYLLEILLFKEKRNQTQNFYNGNKLFKKKYLR